jgi:nitric oxide reductase NorD protein
MSLVRRISSAVRPSRRPTASVGLPLHEVERVLQYYLAGLSQERLVLRPIPASQRQTAYTDGAGVYLPSSLAEIAPVADNFRLYKVMAAHKYALVRYGRLPQRAEFTAFPDPALAVDLFTLIENARIERLLIRELRGLAKDFAFARADARAKRPPWRAFSRRTATVEAALRASLDGVPDPEAPRHALALAERALAGIADLDPESASPASVLALVRDLYGEATRHRGAYQPLRGVHYRGEIRWERWQPPPPESAPPRPDLAGSRRAEQVSQRIAEGQRTELRLDTPVRVRRVVSLPPDVDQGAMGTADLPNLVWDQLEVPDLSGDVPLTPLEREGAFLYPEWDYRRETYKPEWCALRERMPRRGNKDYVAEVLRKHQGLLHLLRQQFEALRPEYLKLRKQKDGDDIDLDEAVQALTDLRAGRQPSENLYIAHHDRRRDIAVAFLVDLSGSVGGWVPEGRIIDIEKEALVLICEALRQLDDKYAIYGFSSATRKQCDFYRIKDFGQDYDEAVRTAIAGMEAFNYTRMGACVRHVTQLLAKLDATVKLLMLISDGRPNDFDSYAGRFGVEDTRQALIEARRRSIRTFCLTVDTEARRYLPHLFGENNYTIIDHVGALRSRLPDVYRRLTAP